MMGIIVVLVLILVILLIIIFGYLYIRAKLSAFSSAWFGTSNFFEGLKNRKQELDEEPKVPYGMDNLLLPEISKDFPYMNVDEMKKVAEESIINYLQSLENETFMLNGNFSNMLKEKVLKKIEDIKNNKFSFKNINIHKTVINQYNKDGSICKMVFQTALGYREFKKNESNYKEERINTEFIYIYDTKKLHGNESISLKCPNCGAPIPGLGHKACPYCQAGLIDLAPKTWKLNDINKV